MYAEENSLLYMETSAKTAMNVNDIFLAIAKKLPKSTPQQQRAGQRAGEPYVRGEEGQRSQGVMPSSVGVQIFGWACIIRSFVCFFAGWWWWVLRRKEPIEMGVVTTPPPPAVTKDMHGIFCTQEHVICFL